MKKALLLTLTLSCFLFAGCTKNTKEKKEDIGQKISNETVSQKIDTAEKLLNEKKYHTIFKQVSNEKTNVVFEREHKMSFNFDMSTESTVTIKNDRSSFNQELVYNKSYGKSSGTGTDWSNNVNEDPTSFAACFNAYSAKKLCDKFNKTSAAQDVEKYLCKDNDNTYLYTKSNKFPESITKEEANPDYAYKGLNKLHYHTLSLIENGFEENAFESYQKDNCITIKLASNYVYGEKDPSTKLLKEDNHLFNQYIYLTTNSRALPNLYPESLDFYITIMFNSDGTYQTMKAYYSFDAKYKNTDCTIMTFLSNGARSRINLKESEATTKVVFQQDEKFNYNNVTVKAPSWISEA